MRFSKAYVEITNVCNRSCSFCPKTGRPGHFMTEAAFTTVLDRLRCWTEYLYFHLMGEPLLHPDLDRFLALAEERGFRVILTTNGTLPDRMEELLLCAPALHKVNLSLQSFEGNEGGDLYDYVNRLTAFAAQASTRGILVNFRLWNLDGADTIGRNRENGRILALLEQAFPKPWQPSRGGERLVDRVYLSWGETFRWPDLRSQDANARHFCYGLKDQIGVLCDGTVVPCCLDHEGDLPLGNLLTEELGEILEKPRTKAILEGFRRGEAVEDLCKCCGYANRFRSN